MNDAQPTLWQRMFPWLRLPKLGSKDQPINANEWPDNEVPPGEYYYDVWYDKYDQDREIWRYEAFAPDGKRIAHDYWFDEKTCARYAKAAIEAYKKTIEMNNRPKERRRYLA